MATYTVTSPYTGETFTAKTERVDEVQMIGYVDEGMKITVTRDRDGKAAEREIGSVSVAYGGIQDAISSAAREIEGVL